MSLRQFQWSRWESSAEYKNKIHNYSVLFIYFFSLNMAVKGFRACRYHRERSCCPETVHLCRVSAEKKGWFHYSVQILFNRMPLTRRTTSIILRANRKTRRPGSPRPTMLFEDPHIYIYFFFPHGALMME